MNFPTLDPAQRVAEPGCEIGSRLPCFKPPDGVNVNASGRCFDFQRLLRPPYARRALLTTGRQHFHWQSEQPCSVLHELTQQLLHCNRFQAVLCVSYRTLNPHRYPISRAAGAGRDRRPRYVGCCEFGTQPTQILYRSFSLKSSPAAALGALPPSSSYTDLYSFYSCLCLSYLHCPADVLLYRSVHVMSTDQTSVCHD